MLQDKGGPCLLASDKSIPAGTRRSSLSHLVGFIPAKLYEAKHEVMIKKRRARFRT